MTKNWIIIFVSAIIAAILLLSGVGVAIIKTQLHAFTDISFTEDATRRYIGELYKGNGEMDKDNLNALLSSVLGGQKPKDYTGGTKDATQIRGEVGKSVVVRLGGLDWLVTYISRDKSNNVIATLYLANIEQEAIPVANRTSTFGKSTGINSTSSGIPTNMYGTSYVRAVSLNNGGKYVPYTGDTANPTYVDQTATQDPNHIYARYTMPSSTAFAGLSNFITTPANVTWQENGQNNRPQFNYNNSSNQNWTDEKTDAAADSNFNSGYNYSDRYFATSASDTTSVGQKLYGNGTWKNDKLWLPSMYETGYRDNTSFMDAGLWQLSVAERSFSGSSFAWLRSANDVDTRACYLITSSGSSPYNLYVRLDYGLRPALHLDLNAAALATGAEIALDQQGGTGGQAKIEAIYGEPMPASVSIPTRTGYDFAGYFTSPNGAGEQYYNATGASTGKVYPSSGGPTTLYAHWTPQTYEVIYENSGFANKLGPLVGGFENVGWIGDQSYAAYYDTAHIRSGNAAMKISAKTTDIEVVTWTNFSVPIDVNTKNHIFYFQYWGYQETRAGINTQVYWPLEEPSVGALPLGAANVWNQYSFYVNRSGNALAGAATPRLDYDNGYNAGEIWFDDMIMLDLTEIFGEGNEPNKEWCDNNIISATTTQTIDSNVAQNLKPMASNRFGYNFMGWATTPNGAVTYTNVQSVTNIAPTGGSITLYAVWEAAKSAVTLDRKGGMGGSGAVTATFDSAMPAATMPTRTGYIFGGYWTGGGGTGTQYYTASGASARNCDLTSATTLYAKWTPITYTITYNGNGADSGSMSNSSHTYDTAKNLNKNAFAKLNCIFLGWSTDKNAKTPQYLDEVSVLNWTTTNGEVITLFAIWQARYTLDISVSIANAGSIMVLRDNALTIEEIFDSGTALKLVAVINNAFTFVGWEVDGVALSPEKLTANPLEFAISANTRVTAIFASSLINDIAVTSTIGGIAYILGDNFDNLGDDDTVTFCTKLALSGYKFSHWQNSAGEILGTDDSIKLKKSEVMNEIVKAVWVPVDNNNVNGDTNV